MQIPTNEILYRIQKALNLTTEEMLEAYKLEAYKMDASHLESLLKRHQDDGFNVATYEELGVFLDGLVTLKRGPSPKKPNDDEAVELTNNLILKKLRIALELKEAETEIIFGLADVELSKQQLASLFRKEGHKNFRACSDELLMAFLDGLNEFYYVGDID
ncbi:hypothetical protein TSL6_08650 [Sulfurovum sp. TSL6]|uniref:DUF1456 family protein n=1 Tax=Sulfurovum sp. TSL6 TaxID=2826995 RepID=UPI001CC3A239|nr:DUF1456 family protein [Sulfurovum sp. TSL6]GIU00359.1 hypothetical protein TSL6_08650 [Sulfurovum sp. TSL6]